MLWWVTLTLNPNPHTNTYTTYLPQEKRKQKLLAAKFRGDTELHDIFARCLWDTAKAANKPWGIGAATMTHLYCRVPIHEKVSVFDNINVSE